MASWNHLPLELKQDILGLCLPDMDDTAIREYISANPDGDNDLEPIQELAEADYKKDVRRIEPLFLICKAWSKALLPALNQHIRDIEKRRNVLKAEISAIPKPPYIPRSWSYQDGCPCCWDYEPPDRKDLLKQWEYYLADREEYARKLHERFCDSPENDLGHSSSSSQSTVKS